MKHIKYIEHSTPEEVKDRIAQIQAWFICAWVGLALVIAAVMVCKGK